MTDIVEVVPVRTMELTDKVQQDIERLFLAVRRSTEDEPLWLRSIRPIFSPVIGALNENVVFGGVRDGAMVDLVET